MFYLSHQLWQSIWTGSSFTRLGKTTDKKMWYLEVQYPRLVFVAPNPGYITLGPCWHNFYKVSLFTVMIFPPVNFSC